MISAPTNKTKVAHLVIMKDYTNWVSNHLRIAADLTICPKVVILFGTACKLSDKVNVLSEREEDFMKDFLAPQATPTPKLIIKDHKKKNYKEELSTSLVIPSTKFTATCAEGGVKAHGGQVRVEWEDRPRRALRGLRADRVLGAGKVTGIKIYLECSDLQLTFFSLLLWTS